MIIILSIIILSILNTRMLDNFYLLKSYSFEKELQKILYIYIYILKNLNILDIDIN